MKTNLKNHSQKAIVAMALVLAASSGSASAHPGHSLGNATFQHILTSPYHLVTLFVGASLLLALSLFVKNAALRTPLRWLGSLGLALVGVLAVGLAR